ncbi:MAG: hypothetical protein QNK31_11600 [Porticoccus sp.]|nr:hypothetical protein [Porticoccus sp.]
MKKHVRLALLSVLIFSGLSQVAQAEDCHKSKRIEKLQHELQLTEQQASSVHTILEQQREKMDLVRDDTHKQLKDILSEEQLAKMRSMRHRPPPRD